MFNLKRHSLLRDTLTIVLATLAAIACLAASIPFRGHFPLDPSNVVLTTIALLIAIKVAAVILERGLEPKVGSSA